MRNIIAVLLITLLLTTGCGKSNIHAEKKNGAAHTRNREAQDTSHRPRLRLINKSKISFREITVSFPDEIIKFGRLPAGKTSPYKWAPNGVYRYAAYEYDIKDKKEIQPVDDFVEAPMTGKSFTYILDVRRDAKAIFVKGNTVFIKEAVTVDEY